ncbi:hypothetical protein SCAR479_08684 [Seiridium cardinale]|uniref:Uncharacterized protein n=1 Tax=Seiridium cardinale TaxID=138064 RepID=A0ABR2XLE6_9PEZI
MSTMIENMPEPFMPPLLIEVTHIYVHRIIFVADLTEDLKTTWGRVKDELESSMVLKPEIYAFEYDSSEVTTLLDLVSSHRLDQHAEKLLDDIENVDLSGCLFVAHGYGGLICEQAYINAITRNSPEERIHGIVLFDTRHFRAGLAEWTLLSAKRMRIDCAKTTRLQNWKELSTDINKISDMQKKFRDREPPPQTVCYFANQIVRDYNLRISPSWAILPGVKSIPVDANHFEMTRLEAIEATKDHGFLGLTGILSGSIGHRLSEADITKYFKKVSQEQEGVKVKHQMLKEDPENPEDKLGEWVGQARGRNGECLLPYLSIEKLSDHLSRTNDKLHQTSDCKASFSWALFLNQLGIRPDDSILKWQPPSRTWLETRDNDMTKSQRRRPQIMRPDIIELQLDFSALVLLVNLYSINARQLHSLREDTQELSFGTLIKTGLEPGGVARESAFEFAVKDHRQLQSAHKPFQYYFPGWNRLGVELSKFPEKPLIASYFVAQEKGISDSKLWPGDSRDLKEDVRLLLQTMESFSKGKADRPYLLTQKWIEFANRVKQRATSQDGTNKVLADHISWCIKEDTRIRQSLEKIVPEWEAVDVEIQHAVECMCFFQNGGFRFSWDEKEQERSWRQQLQDEIIKELSDPLERLKYNKHNLWFQELSSIGVADLVKLMSLPERILNAPVILLRSDDGRGWEKEQQKDERKVTKWIRTDEASIR